MPRCRPEEEPDWGAAPLTGGAAPLTGEQLLWADVSVWGVRLSFLSFSSFNLFFGYFYVFFFLGLPKKKKIIIISISEKYPEAQTSTRLHKDSRSECD